MPNLYKSIYYPSRRLPRMDLEESYGNMVECEFNDERNMMVYYSDGVVIGELAPIEGETFVGMLEREWRFMEELRDAR